jgi:hypothetical protein
MGKQDDVLPLAIEVQARYVPVLKVHRWESEETVQIGQSETDERADAILGQFKSKWNRQS